MPSVYSLVQCWRYADKVSIGIIFSTFIYICHRIMTQNQTIIEAIISTLSHNICSFDEHIFCPKIKKRHLPLWCLYSGLRQTHKPKLFHTFPTNQHWLNNKRLNVSVCSYKGSINGAMPICIYVSQQNDIYFAIDCRGSISPWTDSERKYENHWYEQGSEKRL